jgi:hypothetical protein
VHGSEQRKRRCADIRAAEPDDIGGELFDRSWADLGHRCFLSILARILCGGGDHVEESIIAAAGLLEISCRCFGAVGAGQLEHEWPGLPRGPKLEHGKPCPSTTTDLAKIFAELGFSVSFEDEREALLRYL